jgi:hypothetical protein
MGYDSPHRIIGCFTLTNYAAIVAPVVKKTWVQQMATEEWRSVSNFPRFEISSLGKVRELPSNRTGPKRLNGVVKPIPYRKGDPRWRVDLRRDDGKQVTLIVARLMLTAFVRPPKEGEVARHLDDNCRNDVLENLAWGYPKDNSQDAWRNGRCKPQKWSKESREKLSRHFKGRKLTPEQCRKLSLSKQGKKLSESHKAAISRGLLKRGPMSEEHKAAISVGQTRAHANRRERTKAR